MAPVVEDQCLIGMGAVVLDDAVVSQHALVAASSLVETEQVVPPRTLVAGVPAKVKRELTDEEVEGMERAWKNYLELGKIYMGEVAIGHQ